MWLSSCQKSAWRREFYFLSPNEENFRSMPGRSLKEKRFDNLQRLEKKILSPRNGLNELGQYVRGNIILKQRNLHAVGVSTKTIFFALNEKQFAIACGEACAVVAPRQTASTDFIVRKCGSLLKYCNAICRLREKGIHLYKS